MPTELLPHPPARRGTEPHCLAHAAARQRGGALALAIVLTLVLTAVVGLLAPERAFADEITAGEQRATTQDPNAVRFSVRVTAPAGLESATLSFRVLNPTAGDVGGNGEGAFGPGAENDITFTLSTRSAERFIPVGSIFRYHWELTDRAGDTLVTEEQEYLFLDGRYTWQSQTADNVTVYWYGGSGDFAEAALEATRNTLADTGALLGAEVPYPVRVLIWSNTEEGALAVRPGRDTETEFTRLGGQRVAPDVLFVFDQRIDTVLHEGAHIVTHVAGDGAFARVPAWLDEGTAVYAQRTNDVSYALSLQFAIQNDSTLSLRSLTNPPGRTDLTLLFYGQSFAVVDFLIAEFGREQFLQLYQTIFDGARVDTALEQVYGFTTDGLYNRWREAVGLAPVAVSAPVLNLTPVPEATVAPLAIPTAVPSAGRSATGAGSGEERTPTAAPAGAEADTAPETSPDGDEQSEGADATAGVIVAVASVLLAGLFGGSGIWLLRRQRRT